MIGILEVTIFAFLSFWIMWIMDFFSRSTEIQTRRSTVNLNNIKPDVACTKPHALPRPVINDGFSIASGEDLNNQSFLRSMDETNLIVLENQRLANELSLVQSQLTDSHSKLRQFRNESATTIKSKLEKQKRFITDITEKNLRLTNNDSRLRRKIEDKDRIIASSAIENNLIELEKERLVNELSLVQSQMTDSHSKLLQYQNVHDELATTKRELENNNREMTDTKEKNLHLTNEDSRLRRKIEDRDRLIASSQAGLEKLRTSLAEQQLDKVHEDLVMTKRELELRNRAVTRLEKQNLRLMRNDKRLRRKMKNTNSLLLSGQAESERLRTSLAEQQLDTREFAVATRELETKNATISELETENLRLAENDSRLRRKIEDRDRIIASSAIEKNLIVLDNERLANELSLVQSQLTDSHSKLQMFQNVHDELATTKSELENNKRVTTEIIGENFHLTNENSGLSRKIEAKNRLIAYKRAKLEELHNSLEEKKLHKVHDELASSQRVLASKNKAIIKLQEQNRESRAELEQLRTCLNEQQLDTQQLAVATRELESKSRTITELEATNLSLAENDSQLRRKMEETDLLLLSSKAEVEELQLSVNNQKDTIEQLLHQVKSLDQEKEQAV
jgi:predicted nucleic acid-binding protein